MSDKDYEELLSMGKAADEGDELATAVECFVAASRHKPIPSWAWLRLADNLRAVGRIEEARTILREIDDVPPNKAWLVNLHRGQVEQDAGSFQAAAHRFETAVEQNPSSTVPYVHLASAYSAMQQNDSAIKILILATAAEGDCDEVYLNLGYRYRAKAEYTKAKESFEKALKITPGYPQAEQALRDVISAIRVTGESSGGAQLSGNRERD